MKRREFITVLGSAAATAAYGGVALNAEPKADDGQEDNIVFLTSDDGPGAGTAALPGCD